MNARQEAFCLEYAACGNATQAAIRAGYSADTAYSIGSENLRKPEVQERLRELKEEMESHKIADAKEMQETLTAIIRKELKEEVLMTEGRGDGITETVKKKKSGSIRDITKAIDTLARIQGVYSAGNSVNVVVPIFSGEAELEE